MESHTEARDTFVLAEQVRILYSNVKTTTVPIPLTSLALTALVWKDLSHRSLLIWLAVMLLSTSIRLVLIRAYDLSPSRYTAEQWSNWQVAVTVLLSGGWAWIPIGMLPSLSHDNQFCCTFVLVGMISSSTAALSVIRRVFVIYTLPTVSTLSGAVYAGGGADTKQG